MTNNDFHKIEKPPKNLMFVRFRMNMWNLSVATEAIEYYSKREIPIVLTWMAYHKKESIPENRLPFYSYRKRTQNSYYAIRHESWKNIMGLFIRNKYVYSCGREGVASACKFCGNCLREYYSTIERI